MSCSPLRLVEHLQWGPQGQAGQIVNGPPVPAGEVWLIDNASIATYDGRWFEWMLQRGVNGHYHGLAHGWAAATPVLTWTGRQVMTAGQFLSARVNSGEDFGNGHASGQGMALMYTGWAFPEACLPRLLQVESGGAAPDLSALIEASAAAAAALTALAHSAP